eukprot:528898-Pelagomonas_calceolata.AAC.1
MFLAVWCLLQERATAVPVVSLADVTKTVPVTKGLQGGDGLRPENLADRLLKSIDHEISQKVKARQKRKTISVWKLGKTHTTHSHCNRKEHVSCPGLQHIHIYHKYFEPPNHLQDPTFNELQWGLTFSQ